MSAVLIKSKNRRELGIFIEVFRKTKRAKILMFLFRKAIYVIIIIISLFLERHFF